MKNKISIVAALVILAGGAYYINKIYKKQKEVVFTTQSAIEFIVGEKKATNANALSTFEPEYLKSWAKAIYNKQGSFSYNGSKYNANGGKKIA